MLPSVTAVAPVADNKAPIQSTVRSSHTEFIKRLCVGQNSRTQPVVPPAQAAVVLLGFLSPSHHTSWNEELLDLAQSLLDAAVPLTSRQFQVVVEALDAASRTDTWTDSLKFAAVVYAVVRKYTEQIQQGKRAVLTQILGSYVNLFTHGLTLVKIFFSYCTGRCNSFLANTALDVLNKLT